MRKKFLSCLAILAIAATITFNVSLDSKTNGLTDIMLANVEALAQEETVPCKIDSSYESCNPENSSYYCPCGSYEDGGVEKVDD